MNRTNTPAASVTVNHAGGQPDCRGRRHNPPKNGKKPTPYQKGDGNWYCTLNGKQHYLGTNPLRAQQKLDQIVAGGDHKPITGPTLGEVADLYLKGLENNQSPDTIRSKRSTYGRFLAFVGQDLPMAGVTADTIEQFKQAELLRNSRMSVRSKLIRLSALFEYAVGVGCISENPVRGVAGIKQSSDPDPDHLTDEEVEALLSLTGEQRYPWLRHRDKLVFMLMLHGGLRRIEVSNLKWSDINFDRRLIVLRTTKGLKPRMVGISESLAEVLREYQAKWKKNDEYVVTGRSGGSMSREALSHAARKYIDRLNHSYRGKKRFSLHSLRATFATTLAAKGVGTRVIQGLLGHSDPRTTMRYAAYTERMAVEAVKVLDA